MSNSSRASGQEKEEYSRECAQKKEEKLLFLDWFYIHENKYFESTKCIGLKIS